MTAELVWLVISVSIMTILVVAILWLVRTVRETRRAVELPREDNRGPGHSG